MKGRSSLFRSALVTGGASGIGAAAVALLEAEGVEVGVQVGVVVGVSVAVGVDVGSGV
jgi:NADP-dependent 3-hydroxy acid dehydrogenase YdfG